MARLKLYVFGSPRIERDTQPVVNAGSLYQ